jgi:hypothetical protein
MRKVEGLILKPDLIIQMLGDMSFYEYAPVFIPLRKDVMEIYSKIKVIRQRRCCWDSKIREWYDKLLRRFRSVVRRHVAGDGLDRLAKIKDYLQARKNIDVNRLLIRFVDNAGSHGIWV